MPLSVTLITELRHWSELEQPQQLTSGIGTYPSAPPQFRSVRNPLEANPPCPQNRAGDQRGPTGTGRGSEGSQIWGGGGRFQRDLEGNLGRVFRGRPGGMNLLQIDLLQRSFAYSSLLKPSDSSSVFSLSSGFSIGHLCG